MVWWHVVLVVLISYLFGNISFARIISKLKKSDITKLGSGNPGSTNMLRNFGFKIGILNLILDMLLGIILAFATFMIFKNTPVMLYISGLSVIIGHVYPVIYKFKGGKGIATMIGFFFACDWLVTLIVVLVAAISWLIFQYGSVASFICVTVLTVWEGIGAKATLPEGESKIICLLLFAVFLLTWFAHRGNIERLLFGKESKVSLIKKTKNNIKQGKN